MWRDLAPAQGGIDGLDDPFEELDVHRARDRVARGRRLVGVERYDGRLAGHAHRACGEALCQVGAQRLGRVRERLS